MVTEQEVEAIGQVLVDPKQPLQARFRALFTLRGLGGPGAIAWISRAFDDDSALLKHELAYCLGQMQDSRAIPVLTGVLRDTRQEPMVRHEAGEGQCTSQPGRGPGDSHPGDCGATPAVWSGNLIPLGVFPLKRHSELGVGRRLCCPQPSQGDFRAASATE